MTSPVPRLWLSALLAGCLVAHRPSDALYVPFLLGLAYFPMARFPAAALAFSLGYLPYAHTWWHLQNRFSMAYFDYPKDAVTFFGILTGKLYANNLFTLSPVDSLVELKHYLGLLARQLGPLLPFALAGIAAMRRHRRPELLTILGIGLVNVVFCTNYNVIETNTMVLPSLALAAWAAGYGLQAGLKLCGAWRGRAAAAAMLWPIALIGLGWRECDRSGFRDVSRYLGDLHAIVPGGAQVLATTDIDALAVLYGRFCLGRRADLGITILDDWKPDVAATVGRLLGEGRRVYGSLFLVREQFLQAQSSFRLRREGFLYRLEPLYAGPDGPGSPGAGREVAPGVVLEGARVPARWAAGPGLCAFEADWRLLAGRTLARPALVCALFPPGGAAVPEAARLFPISGLFEAPGAGLWRDRYRFRLPATIAPGPYSVRFGVVDLERLKGSIGAGGAIEAFDPARVPGLDFWKERQMQYLLAIRECVPYHAESWRVRDWEALVRERWLAGGADGEGLLAVGGVEVVPFRDEPIGEPAVWRRPSVSDRPGSGTARPGS